MKNEAIRRTFDEPRLKKIKSLINNRHQIAHLIGKIEELQNESIVGRLEVCSIPSLSVLYNDFLVDFSGDQSLRLSFPSGLNNGANAIQLNQVLSQLSNKLYVSKLLFCNLETINKNNILM